MGTGAGQWLAAHRGDRDRLGGDLDASVELVVYVLQGHDHGAPPMSFVPIRHRGRRGGKPGWRDDDGVSTAGMVAKAGSGRMRIEAGCAKLASSCHP